MAGGVARTLDFRLKSPTRTRYPLSMTSCKHALEADQREGVKVG